ncbi:MAG TPA: PAS domain-containing protein [Candidatus Acidoferrales bacterium]|nr:PAS domain-containing protein [Candidatus Acidoferrales bacterium]
MSIEHDRGLMNDERRNPAEKQMASQPDAEAVLSELASLFSSHAASSEAPEGSTDRRHEEAGADETAPKPEDMYRALVEQIPAVVFIAYLERGISEAYVSPQIESALGFSREEWLEDPIRWYRHIYPEDKHRWSVDAADLFAKGKPLKSSYRVIARDGRVAWFQCEAKMVRRKDGRPWFLQGVGFDISGLKQTEEALQERTAALQNLSSHLLRAQDEERRRIARELHDSLGQYLTALKINLDLISRSSGSGIDAFCAESQQIVERCIHETRTLSHLLHPPLLDEIGFAAAAHWYVEGFAKRSDVRVTLDLPAKLQRLPDAVEIALFRVLQETLTNIHRHSESPTAEIQLGIDDAEVSLKIKDHGRGIRAGLLQQFQKTGGGTGVGLSGMRERVNELGGRLEISSDSEGTFVNATIPVSAKCES